MPQEFFTVENAVTGGRARVPQRRLAHLNDDWKVVDDDPPARPRKRTAPREAATLTQAPDTAVATDAATPESAAGADLETE